MYSSIEQGFASLQHSTCNLFTEFAMAVKMLQAKKLNHYERSYTTLNPIVSYQTSS